MNKAEYLLTCLIEECSEVQKEATKALRFGLEDDWKERGTQASRIAHEFCDLISVYDELVKEGLLEDVSTAEMIEMKQQRLDKYMGYARERGTLVD
jgi:hypothetical protein